MDITTWWEILLTNQTRVANVIQQFYPSAVENFNHACVNKQDGEAHRIIHETWFRNLNKGWGPDGWGIIQDLVSGYPL